MIDVIEWKWNGTSFTFGWFWLQFNLLLLVLFKKDFRQRLQSSVVDLPTVANALIFQATISVEANNFLYVSYLLYIYFLIAVFIFSTTTISLTWFSSHHHRKQTTFFVFLSFSFSYFPFFLSVYSIRELNFLMFHFTVEMFYLGKVSFFMKARRFLWRKKVKLAKVSTIPHFGILQSYPAHTRESSSKTTRIHENQSLKVISQIYAVLFLFDQSDKSIILFR